jgi:DNA-binding NarL/FixJ family response regulator
MLDITMPGRNGLEALRDIKAEKPEVAVLMLSIHPEDQYAIRALKCGASGYLTKESAPEELVRAIQKVVNGGRYVTESLAERLADQVGGGGGITPHEQLSDREFEVLRKIGQWIPVSQIATEMSLSVKTISTYRTRILDKLGLKTTADLIRYVQENMPEE